jgi:hypothetical protein
MDVSLSSAHRICAQVSVLDRAIEICLLMLAALPFWQIQHLRLGFITLSAGEMLYLSIIGLAGTRLLCGGRGVSGLPLIAFLWMLLLWGGLPLIEGTSNAVLVFRQARLFLPFVAALTLLASGFHRDPREFLRRLVVATGISALGALAIHHLWPALLRQAFATAPDIHLLAIRHGRLYWGNSSLLLLCLPVMLATPTPRHLTLLTITTLAMVNTFNRTILAGVALVVIGRIMLNRRVSAWLRGIMVGGGLALLITVMALGLGLFDARWERLARWRVPGFGTSLGAVWERAVEGDRRPIYQQLAQRFSGTFPWGLGLGRPLYRLGEQQRPFFSADLSLAAFALPFGLAGPLMLAFFLWTLTRALAETAAAHQELGILLLPSLLAGMAVSFNIDLLSRDPFVLLLTAAIICGHGRAAAPTSDGIPGTLEPVRPLSSQPLPNFPSQTKPISS